MGKFSILTVKPEVPMNEEVRRVWDEIAERNTAALEQLVAMTTEQRAALTCVVEDIPNPFKNCTSVFY